MNKVIALTLALAFSVVTACGNSAPPKPAGSGKEADKLKTPDGPKNGKSYVSEYNKAMSAAFAAEKAYNKASGDAQTPGSAKSEAYVAWAEKLYAALAFASMHGNNGHKLEKLPKLRLLKQSKGGDFKNALGPSDDPRVKTAMKNWKAAGQ